MAAKAYWIVYDLQKAENERFTTRDAAEQRARFVAGTQHRELRIAHVVAEVSPPLNPDARVVWLECREES